MFLQANHAKYLALVGIGIALLAALAAQPLIGSLAEEDHSREFQLDLSAPEHVCSADDTCRAQVGRIATASYEIQVESCQAEPETLDLSTLRMAMFAPIDEATESQALWEEAQLSTDELPMIGRPGCAYFVHRGTDGGGEIWLLWSTATTTSGEGQPLDVTMMSRRLLPITYNGLISLVFFGGVLLLFAGQLTEPKKDRPWTVWFALFPLLVFLILSDIAAGFATTRGHAHLATLAAVAIYVGTTWVLANRVIPGRPLAALAFHGIRGWQWLLSIFFGIALAIGAAILLPLFPQGESAMVEMLEGSSGIMAILTLAFIAPWAEELLLRGALFGGLERAFGALAAVLGSACVFSLLHFVQHWDGHWSHMGPWLVVTVTGLGLSLIRWGTGSTLASTISHMTYNLILTLPVLLTG